MESKAYIRKGTLDFYGIDVLEHQFVFSKDLNWPYLRVKWMFRAKDGVFVEDSEFVHKPLAVEIPLWENSYVKALEMARTLLGQDTIKTYMTKKENL
jgi:hypothetical protein